MRVPTIKLAIGSVVTMIGVLACAPEGQAAHVFYQVGGVPHDVPTIATFDTYGDTMDGMEVTAFFSTGIQETATWKDMVGPKGGATGAGSDWSLTELGHTFGGTWTLTYNALGTAYKGVLTDFEIDGFAKFEKTGDPNDGVAFDRTFDNAVGTPGSSRGMDFSDESFGHGAPPFFIHVTYSDPISADDDLAHPGPREDLYRRMAVRFSGVNGAFGLDGVDLTELKFLQDTDNPTVPEPGSITLLVCGAMAGLIWWRRRR